MSYMFEIYYAAPVDSAREQQLSEKIAALGGHLDYREEPNNSMSSAVILTYEFDKLDDAESAAEMARKLGEHVKGPVDYA